MIRGKFILSTEDASEVFALREKVFGAGEKDMFDAMAVYAVAYDEDGTASGAGRLCIDGDGAFTVDAVGVLPDRRGRYLGDLLMRMLLYRALQLNAPRVHLFCGDDVAPFFARYGFKTAGEGEMCASAAEIDIEGSCGCCN
ncbi:MAG: GNAT family N-acetyltransferase [Christensenellales bacterium]|jgi:N-acetylglutamate synthase-like GNAT family acetyltransferase